ncbi:uracil phosphoribosyltransferase isoform X1 [Coffea arabica]|uniref:uracil phosphoribosyltransferase n=1 Tax=Coffea arabica TaxID=13443 RepID=A0A6P6SKC3_COFAR|nr:uracil phosphoribosyltransferase isoform X1 [Coffea arabica]XP_027066309.1 uracil phosphoribosyltransferase isoform X2 [Coffea arabica]
MAVPIYNYYYSPLLRCPPCASPSSSSPPYHQLHLLSPNSLHSSSPSLYHLKNQSIISATITQVFPLSRRRRRALTMDCQTTPEQKSISQERMLVFVPPHPLIKHWVSVLRNEDTPTPIFKSAMAELGRLLMYEASRDWLPTISGEIQSPLGVATVEFIDPREPVAVVPILRAGLALAEHASSILPASKTYHLGISRNEETLQPTVYLNKLPDRFPEGSRVFVVDPMLATGGTIVAALNLIKERGVDNKQIKVVSAVAAPPALQKLSEKFPGLHVYAGNIDPTVNDKGFIIPGVGDAGDRSFGT